MNHFLIAIDQGGTKTDVLVLTNTGEILAYADDRDIREFNDHFEDKRYFYIRNTIKKALLTINSSLDDVDYILAAMCEADWEEDYIKMQNILFSTLSFPKDKIIIVNDSIAALRSGMPLNKTDSNYAVICAGTRFNCSLLSQNGKEYTYGRFINNKDHGAFAIGQQIWSAIIDSHNGFQVPTILEKLFLKYYGKESLLKLYVDLTSNRVEFNPSQLALLLVEAVNCDDEIAINIMDNFVYRWVQYVIQGLYKIDLTNKTKFTLVLAGGIFQNGDTHYIDKIKHELNHRCPNADCAVSPLKPIAGAAFLLLDKYYNEIIDQSIIDQFINSSFYQKLLTGINYQQNGTYIE